MPCPLARRVPRAGQRPRPRPGEGRPGGGGEEAPTLLLRPPDPLPGDRDRHLGMGLTWGPPRSKESLGRGSVSRLSNPFPDQGICSGIRPGFVHSCVEIVGRRRIGSLRAPLPPPVSCAWILPSLGARGMGHAPVTSLWLVGGHLAEGDPSGLGPVHPLVAISGCVGGTSFSWGVSQSPPPVEALPGEGRENLYWEGDVREWTQRTLPPSGARSLPGAFVRVGVDLPFPEARFEGPEPGCLKWCPVRFDSHAALWGWFRCCVSSALGACLAEVSAVLRNAPRWENPLTSSPS